MIMEKYDLTGKVAIITGGGTGLGKAIALALARAGADIVCAARRIGPLEETAAEVRGMGRKALAVVTDVTDSHQVNTMVERTIQELGKVDILVNNAGGGTSHATGVPLSEIDDEQWHTGLDLELSGAFYCCRAVAQPMMERRRGKIINMSSTAGLLTSNHIVYDIAKAGLLGLTRVLAFQWAPYGININALAPSNCDTEVMKAWGDNLPKVLRATPDGRLGRPEEIAGLALYLASDTSDYVTGQYFIIDGGAEAGRYLPVGYERIVPW